MGIPYVHTYIYVCIMYTAIKIVVHTYVTAPEKGDLIAQNFERLERTAKRELLFVFFKLYGDRCGQQNKATYKCFYLSKRKETQVYCLPFPLR